MRRTTIVAVGLLALTAACGGDDAATSTSASPTASSPKPTATYPLTGEQCNFAATVIRDYVDDLNEVWVQRGSTAGKITEFGLDVQRDTMQTLSNAGGPQVGKISPDVLRSIGSLTDQMSTVNAVIRNGNYEPDLTALRSTYTMLVETCADSGQVITDKLPLTNWAPHS